MPLAGMDLLAFAFGFVGGLASLALTQWMARRCDRRQP